MRSQLWAGLLLAALAAGCGAPEARVGVTSAAVSRSTFVATVDLTGGDCGLCGRMTATCINGKDSRKFADPLPQGQGWTARAVEVRIFGSGCDAQQVEVSVDGNALPMVNTTTGMCGCMSCDLLAVTNFDVAPPGVLPGWAAGGMNTLTISTAAKLCAAYATVTITADQGLSIAPTRITLIGPAGVLTPPQTLTITNSAGTDPLEIHSLSVGGADPASFGITGPMTPLMVPVGAAAKFDVTCTPNGDEKTADLILATLPTGTVALSMTCDVFVPHPLGDGCLKGDFCESGFCVDGVCCDGPCTDQCAACNVFGKKGRCIAVNGKPVGTRAACAGSPPCQGLCDGKQTAQCNYPFGVTCNPAKCEGSVASVAATCDGAGACTPGATTNCDWGCLGAGCAPRPPDMASTDDAALPDGGADRAPVHDAGGCGCRVARAQSIPTPGALLVIAVVFGMKRRRAAKRAVAERS